MVKLALAHKEMPFYHDRYLDSSKMANQLAASALEAIIRLLSQKVVMYSYVDRICTANWV